MRRQENALQQVDFVKDPEDDGDGVMMSSSRRPDQRNLYGMSRESKT
jgi:hypothetical protein